jgi:hypothetical protein
MGMKKVTAASVAMVLMTSSSALAQTVKYDENIAKAAAEKAAEKVGDIRGLINFDQVPDLVTKEDLAEKPVNTSFFPSLRDINKNALPPMTSIFPDIDMTVTGSINGRKVKIVEKVIWEKFDRNGNPIK